MAFSAPIWLLLLVPWAGLLFYLMLGKPPRAPVPFLALWRGPEAKRSVKPAVAKLPVWVGLMMLAAAAAALAVAGPVRRTAPIPGAVVTSPLGITAAAVRADQVMVRVLNRSSGRDATLELSWPGGGRTEAISLPAAGEQAYFFDLPADLPRLSLRVDGHTVELTRQRAFPTIEPYTPLPDSLRRMQTAYRSARPAGGDAGLLAIAADEPTLAGRPGVILASARAPTTGRASVTDHPVTRDVDWPTVLADARAASTGAPPGFTPLVRVGDTPAVAVRTSPRQVWVGFDAPDFASRVDYVVFWSNAFDFAGGGVDQWQPVAGTQFAHAADAKRVQTDVQNLAPAVAIGAAVLTLLSLLTLIGHSRRGRVRKGQYPT